MCVCVSLLVAEKLISEGPGDIYRSCTLNFQSLAKSKSSSKDLNLE